MDDGRWFQATVTLCSVWLTHVMSASVSLLSSGCRMILSSSWSQTSTRWCRTSSAALARSRTRGPTLMLTAESFCRSVRVFLNARLHVLFIDQSLSWPLDNVVQRVNLKCISEQSRLLAIELTAGTLWGQLPLPQLKTAFLKEAQPCGFYSVLAQGFLG